MSAVSSGSPPMSAEIGDRIGERHRCPREQRVVRRNRTSRGYQLRSAVRSSRYALEDRPYGSPPIRCAHQSLRSQYRSAPFGGQPPRRQPCLAADHTRERSPPGITLESIAPSRSQGGEAKTQEEEKEAWWGLAARIATWIASLPTFKQ